MLIWLMALFLLTLFIYVVYRLSFFDNKPKNHKLDNHYTFKI
jgi:hypothetical protein